jgi:hypothetical protein
VLKIPQMNRELLRVALRVLTSVYYGNHTQPSDVAVLHAQALPNEQDLRLDELARRMIRRAARVNERTELSLECTDDTGKPCLV